MISEQFGMTIQEHDQVEERASTRMRHFLAHTRPCIPLEGFAGEVFWEARSLIENLALDCEMTDDIKPWSNADCAVVLQFITLVHPVEGSCYCDSSAQSRIDMACGFHAVLDFIRESIMTMYSDESMPTRPIANDDEAGCSQINVS